MAMPAADGDPLAQRSGGRLDAGGVAEFRVARRAAAELAEVLQVLQRQIVAGQVQHAVEQRRGVAAGKDEAVAAGPGGLAGLCRRCRV